MEQKKPFKYYAIRVHNMIVFRRTVGKLNKVRSLLWKPRSDFRMEQITYTGGKVVGCMTYTDWVNHGGRGIGLNGCLLVNRDHYRALGPYINASN